MKIKLIDRITLPTIFPEKSSFEKLIIVADIQKKVAITQEEVKEFEIQSENDMIKWNEKGGTTEFDIDFTESETNLISDLLKKLSTDESLTARTLQLYKLFVK